jgi:hypothetical protein
LRVCDPRVCDPRVCDPKVAVVVPSRLAPRPGGMALAEFGPEGLRPEGLRPELWLDGALGSVLLQVGYSEASWDVFVGVDPGALVPSYVQDHAHVARARRPGQAAAVNAAAAAALAASRPDVLLFLEDDDRWRADKFRLQAEQVRTTPFVSCSQRLVDAGGTPAGGSPAGRCDYPTPSTWLMEADVWRKVGGFDEGLRWLVDTEWLGRLSAAGVSRAHLVEEGLLPVPNQVSRVARNSLVVPRGRRLLVDRTVNDRGGMAKIATDLGAAREADAEAALVRKRFGCDPW